MLELLLTIAVIGFVAWLVLTYVPMPEPIRTVVTVGFSLVVVVYVLRALGVDLL